jgi:DNA polymerase-3 subunit epsilon
MPLVAFRAEFDQIMLSARCVDCRFAPRRTWIDLAFLLPALFSVTECRTLDDWLGHFGLAAAAERHHRRRCVATAQLLQISSGRAHREGIGTASALVAMQKAQRWLGMR